MAMASVRFNSPSSFASAASSQRRGSAPRKRRLRRRIGSLISIDPSPSASPRRKVPAGAGAGSPWRMTALEEP